MLKVLMYEILKCKIHVMNVSTFPEIPSPAQIAQPPETAADTK